MLAVVANLEVADEVKKTINEYIENNQNDPELAEKMAKVLEVMADQSDMAAEQLKGLLVSLGDLKEDLQSQSDIYDEESENIMDKYQSDTLSGIEELNSKFANKESEAQSPAIPAAPVVAGVPVQPNPGYGGQQYNATTTVPTPTATPTPEPLPAVPVMGE